MKQDSSKRNSTLVRKKEYANASQELAPEGPTGMRIPTIMVVTLGLAALFAAPALADPRLDEVVYSPYIENHMFELETRFGQEIGDGSLKGAQTVVNEFENMASTIASGLALVSTVERSRASPQRLSGLGVEGIFYIGQIPKIGVDAGLYLEVTKGMGGEANGGEAKLLLAKTAGRFQGLVNFIVERPFSGPPGEVFAAYGYAASAHLAHRRSPASRRRGGRRLRRRSHLPHPRPGAYLGPQLKCLGGLQPRVPALRDRPRRRLAGGRGAGPRRGRQPGQDQYRVRAPILKRLTETRPPTKSGARRKLDDSPPPPTSKAFPGELRHDYPRRHRRQLRNRGAQGGRTRPGRLLGGWCGPCKQIAPALEQIAEELKGVVTVAKLDIEENPATPSRYGVRGIPTMMLFQDGRMASMKVGALPKQKILDWLGEAGVALAA